MQNMLPTSVQKHGLLEFFDWSGVNLCEPEFRTGANVKIHFSMKRVSSFAVCQILLDPFVTL